LASFIIVKQTIGLTFLAGYLEPLYALGNCTAQLDVVVSLAVAAVSAPKPYVRPHVKAHQPNGSGGIHILDFRHPCLEFQDTVSVIPNDVHLERGNYFLNISEMFDLFKVNFESFFALIF
uniref:Sulfate_transp domain-containing protein n=1 Tax=Hydatigena taeniaeformis TaxID=6205 RepID=A0A0R3WVY5_HYDTA